MLERISEILDILNFTLGSRAKNHLIGGSLLSISLMFGGLALTAMTLPKEDPDE